MEIRNPEFRKSVAELIRKAAFINDVGVQLEVVEPGRCVSSLQVSARHLQQHGFVHAAVQAALADHTAGAAAGTLVGPDEGVLSVEFKINLLRPAVGQLLRCQSTVLRAGKSLSVVESEVWAVSAGGDERLTSKATVTLAVVKEAELAGGTAEAVEVVDTREGYDRWAEVYDGEGNPLIALEEPEVDGLLGDVRGLQVADIGCGTGRHVLRLLAQGAKVVGLDFSEGMLGRARAKLPPGAAVHLLVHDLGRPLPLADASCDRVLCALVLDHVEALEALFREMKRVCRPDGAIVATVMHPAMLLRGVEARFRDPRNGRETRPRSQPHQVSAYVNAVSRAGLRVDLFREHAVGEALAECLPRARKYLGWPMLLAMRLCPR